ncbi:HAD-like domain-containing protein [Mycena vulgaris]|nr:HAD-like domain-containing protein [Mycena vulgaris]
MADMLIRRTTAYRSPPQSSSPSSPPICDPCSPISFIGPRTRYIRDPDAQDRLAHDTGPFYHETQLRAHDAAEVLGESSPPRNLTLHHHRERTARRAAVSSQAMGLRQIRVAIRRTSPARPPRLRLAAVHAPSYPRHRRLVPTSCSSLQLAREEWLEEWGSSARPAPSPRAACDCIAPRRVVTPPSYQPPIYENYLARIASLVPQAQATRSRFQDLADLFSAVVLPVSAACSAIAFVVWFLVNRYGRHLSSTRSAVSELTYALAILIVPLIVAAALRAGRREGMLFRSSEALQRAHNVDVVVLDKTGTLSSGLYSLERKELLAPGAVLAHVFAHINRPPDSGAQSHGIISFPGMGVKSTLAGYPLLGGNQKFTGAAQHPFIQEFTAGGLTLSTVTLAGELVAAFGLADMPRADAPALLEALALRGKRVFVLSGDNAGAVARFAATLPIEPGDAQAACTPAGKAELVTALQARGRRVCFVGDGTNDAPALAQADVALCITTGADVAVAAAGALVGENMKLGVLAALDVARHAQQHIVVALGWCVLYNAAALLFAGGIFVRVRIEPRWAGPGELVSLVLGLVVGFALDLRWRWRRH